MSTTNTATKFFKNANFTRRNYECTNIVGCEAASLELAQQAMPNAKLVECKESELARMNLSQLWIQGGVRILGWL